MDQLPDLGMFRVQESHEVLHPPASVEREGEIGLIIGQRFQQAEEFDRNH